MSDESLNTHDKIELVMRQTNYTKEEALQYLNEANGDIHAVIRMYLTGSKSIAVKNEKKSVNQQIYSSIRGYLDAHTKDLQTK